MLCGELGITDLVEYPTRFFVNVTSYIRWYRDRGVDATAVILVRDKSLRLRSAIRDHCPNRTAAKQQFMVGTRILREAISSLSAANGEILVASYEVLMTIQDEYLHTIYDQLGFKSKFIPRFNDGNVKYLT